jgi:uncharacterized phage-associated protein
MPNIFNTAAYILQKKGALSAMKLQNLVYYSQAWALVWDDAPLFNEPIQAWANGPVSPALFDVHSVEYLVTLKMVEGQQDGQLSAEQLETIDTVLKFYGKYDTQQLSDQANGEPPHMSARAHLKPTERGCSVITHASLVDYYGRL